MVKLFVLIKRKGTKKYSKVIPTRKGSLYKNVLKQARKEIGKAFNFKIVNLTQLKKLLASKQKL